MLRYLILAIGMAISPTMAHSDAPALMRDATGVLHYTDGGVRVTGSYVLLDRPRYSLGIVVGSDTTVGYQHDRYGLIYCGLYLTL